MKRFKVEVGADKTTTLKVPSSEKFAIEIDGAGTTGYGWEISNDSEGFKVTDHSIKPNLESFGAAGVDEFILEAAPGMHTLKIDLRAPWESAPAKQIKLKINSK